MTISRLTIGGIFAALISLFFWETYYFSMGEAIVIGTSSYISFFFLYGWYKKIYKLFSFFKLRFSTLYLASLPIIVIFFYLVVLKTGASWDVVGATAYIFMYVALGVAWICLSLNTMLAFLSFSYIDDVLMMPNKAALYTLSGIVVGSSLIYAGANVGDGPGFVSVLVAGLLGTGSWLFFAILIDRTSGIMNQIIREHRTDSGLRFFGYLISMSLILAKASSGDWTSFTQTIIEFLSGWPVLPLVIFAILVENSYFSKKQIEEPDNLQLPSLLVVIGSITYSLFIVLQHAV